MVAKQSVKNASNYLAKVQKHVVALLLLAVLLIYIGLELSFNLLLIDVYALPLANIFGDAYLVAGRTELLGRTLSSFGISLAVVSMLSLSKLPFLGWFEKNRKAAKPYSKVETGIIKCVLFLVLWAMLVPSLRFLVDGWAHATSDETKLSAVRAIAYREAYLNDLVEIDRFDEFNQIASDTERRDLVVALLPSLAFTSAGFNNVIEKNVEAMADTLLKNRQKTQFTEQGLPKLRAFDQVYQKEYARYASAQSRLREAELKVNDFDTLEAETSTYLRSLDLHMQAGWKQYVQLIDKAWKDTKQYKDNESLLDGHGKFKKQYKSCKSDSCREDVKSRHAKWLNDTDIPLLRVKADNIYFSGLLLKPDDRIHSFLHNGRRNALQDYYGVSADTEDYEVWIASRGASRYAREFLAEKGIMLSESWTLSNSSAIFDAIQRRYQKQLDEVWPAYLAESTFKIDDKRLDKFDFSMHPKTEAEARRQLGRFYLEGFSPGEAESAYFTRWLDSQDNISFIRMLSSTAAGAAFSPGGALYNIGVDAVKLSIVPQSSIVLSFIAIFLIAFRYGSLLFKHYGTGYALVVGVIITFALIVPTARSLLNNNSYSAMMGNFSEEFHKDDLVSRLKMKGFGIVLDLENGVFTTFRDSPVKRLVASKLYAFGEDKDGNPIENKTILAFREYDDKFNDVFSLIPGQLFELVERPEFNANISLIKPDNSIAAYMGVNVVNGKVESVGIPNFLADTDLGFLAEQAYLLNTNADVLALDYILNYDDPEYWMDVASGKTYRMSVLAKMENALPVVINGNKPLVKLLTEQVNKGNGNIILFQRNLKEHYECLVMPTMVSSMLANALVNNQVDYTRIEDCWISL